MAPLRLVVGLVKGAALGAAVGFAATRAGLVPSSGAAWLIYGAVGLVTGFLCGKPPWRQSTIWTSVFKGIFGVGAALGLAWLARRFLGGLPVPIPGALGAAAGALWIDVPTLLGAALGGAYGGLIELDDGAADPASDDKKLPGNRKKSLPAR